MTNRLYIIGNGFDLHHKLKTEYVDFANYLKMNDKELYKTLKKYISFPKKDKKLWSNFETNLANLDAKSILINCSFLLPDFSKEELRPQDREVFPSLMEEYLNNMTIGLLKIFKILL